MKKGGRGLFKQDTWTTPYAPAIKRVSDLSIARRFDSSMTFVAACEVARMMASEFETQFVVSDEFGGNMFFGPSR